MKTWLEDSYWQRQRQINITEPNKGSEIRSAVSTLGVMPGVIAAKIFNNRIHVEYDLRKIDLSAIRSTIINHKLTISENPWERLGRWFSEYTEAVRREEEHMDFGWDAWIQAAYVNRYRLRRHGRRDDRVTNWRQYEVAEQISGHQNNPR